MIINRIAEKLEIKTVKKAKELVEKCIKDFENYDKPYDVWGQLYLLFSEHQEIYDIDDTYEDLLEDENAFTDICNEIELNDLIGTIYVHYNDEDDDSGISCGISSLFLDYYISAYKDCKKKKIFFEEENPNNGLRGEPYEITRYIDSLKGREYYDDLIMNFPDLIERENRRHFAIPAVTPNWGSCYCYIYSPQDIKDIFNVKVKNDYIFYILSIGEIIITTALSYNYLSTDTNFVKKCEDMHKITTYGETFQEKLYYRDNYLFGCEVDISIIRSIKLFKGIPENEKDKCMLKAVALSNLQMRINHLEGYCNEICKNIKR